MQLRYTPRCCNGSPVMEREHSVLSAAAAEPYKAVVFGSTGAVGKEVVRALAESEQCQSVVAIVR